MRWLTALGVTCNSSAATVTLRSRARASKACRHWMGGMRGGDMAGERSMSGAQRVPQRHCMRWCALYIRTRGKVAAPMAVRPLAA